MFLVVLKLKKHHHVKSDRTYGLHNIAEQLLSPFYEYNFCDHPEHEEFISQVMIDGQMLWKKVKFSFIGFERIKVRLLQP